ncbi:MAG: AIPR family protein, partial [bacterium]
EVMRVGFARLADLHAMYRGMQSRFFDGNIRGLLSTDTSTNRSLSRAFKEILTQGARDPLAFAFDHNGVTLYAERVEAQSDGLLVTEPRLLNGVQTIATLDRFLKSCDTPPPALDQVRVLCKLISDARSDFVLGITLNNNRQNPVRPWNLRANDLIQLELQDKFGEELGLYYERQEKAFENLTAGEMESLEVSEDKALELLKLAQTFLASDGEIERMSRLAEMFEREDEYRLVFNAARLKADARRILLCYKVQFRLSRIVREIMERGEKKYAYMRRARNLVWALLCQALLNEERLEDLAEKYGRSLAVEKGFTELLSKLAADHVRFAVAEAADQPPYAAMIEQERYGFLRTQSFCDACLKYARARWGWKDRRL